MSRMITVIVSLILTATCLYAADSTETLGESTKIDNTGSSTKEYGILENEITEDTYIPDISEKRTVSSIRSFQQSLQTGRNANSIGLILHFGGLLGSVFNGIVPVRNSGDATRALTMSIVFGAMQIAGPIIACVSASGVDEAAESAGVTTGDAYGYWKDYQNGWKFTALGTGILLADILIISANVNSGNSSIAVVALPIAIVGCFSVVAGEVFFVKSLIRSSTQISNVTKRAHAQGLIIGVVPQINFEQQQYGLAVRAGF